MNTYSFEYNSADYDPAAPVIEITIQNIGDETKRLTTTALLDSGADATMLPKRMLRELQALYIETRMMRGVTGRPVKVDCHLVNILIGDITIYSITAIGMASNSEPIIGRNVLNQLVVTLNGLADTTIISDMP